MELDILTDAAKSYITHIESEKEKDIAYQAFVQGALWQRWRNPAKPPTNNIQLARNHAAESNNTK